MVSVIAKEFGVLPSAAAREIERDPMHLNEAGFQLLRYGEAKQAFDRAKNAAELDKHWRGSKVMAEVKRNTRDLARERKAAKAAKG